MTKYSETPTSIREIRYDIKSIFEFARIDQKKLTLNEEATKNSILILKNAKTFAQVNVFTETNLLRKHVARRRM